jgi:hypothetical protein
MLKCGNGPIKSTEPQVLSSLCPPSGRASGLRVGYSRENTSRCDPGQPECDGSCHGRLNKANDSSMGAHEST